MTKVLVTGGNGYLGTHVIAALAHQGRKVRATVRSLNSEPEIREMLRRSGADDNGLEVVTTDLKSDDGWGTAMIGVEEVHHVASPIPLVQPEDPDELIIPAREGTLPAGCWRGANAAHYPQQSRQARSRLAATSSPFDDHRHRRQPPRTRSS